MDAVSPIDNPNKMASLGLTTFAPGREDMMELNGCQASTDYL